MGRNPLPEEQKRRRVVLYLTAQEEERVRAEIGKGTAAPFTAPFTALKTAPEIAPALVEFAGVVVKTVEEEFPSVVTELDRGSAPEGCGKGNPLKCSCKKCQAFRGWK